MFERKLLLYRLKDTFERIRKTHPSKHQLYPVLWQYRSFIGAKFQVDLLLLLQGLSVPFACIGSGDPVRVLRLYTMNTLDIF